MAGRVWGYWTKGKLDILRKYLDAFTTATKNHASERIYIDAFAGEPENRDRLTGDSIEGSARIALSIDNPPFTRLRFFETKYNAPRLQESLSRDFPSRDLRVLGGDCNEQIPLELQRLHKFDWAPAFAFLDPNGTEAAWDTVRTLALFKQHRKYKVELFLLIPVPMFMRLLPVDGRKVRNEDAESISRMFGTDEWYHIYQARLDGEIRPSDAREEYLNLIRWRIENQLSYNWTHYIEVRNEAGSIIYYLIFATDHEAGDRIIRHLYAEASAEFPRMREEARRLRQDIEEEQRGVTSLFGPDHDELRAPPQPGERFYHHEPPWRPWFL